MRKVEVMEKFLWAKKNRVKNIQKTVKKAEADEKRLQLNKKIKSVCC